MHAVAQAFAAAGDRRRCPRVSTLVCASVREADPGRNQGQMGGYRAGIYADLAPERGHMRLFAGFLAVGLRRIGSQPREAVMVFAR